MRAFTARRFRYPLPAGHRFPEDKYGRVCELVVARGLLAREALCEPPPAAPADLALVHEPGYLAALDQGSLPPAAVRRLGLPLSPELVERGRRSTSATVEAARDALADGAGLHLGGGTHHAFADRGEGYCVFNDVAVAVEVLRRDGCIRRAAVVDLDVHQGNGTARIFAGRDDVLTFSMHGERNYPFVKEQSTIDVGLPDGCGDARYLELLEQHLGPLLEEARPDLVFFLAGVDPYGGDRLGRLALSAAGLRERDRRVITACQRRGLPLVVLMAGGYAHDLGELAELHAATVEELVAAYS